MKELPQSQFGLYGPGTYTRCRTKKLAALENYLHLLKYLMPTDPSIAASYLWHCDFYEENIFVNPERPWEIASIIDWQSSELLPLFDHARQPGFLDYDGPRVEGIEQPALPENFHELSADEQAKADNLNSLMSLSAFYRFASHHFTPHFYKAMEFKDTTSCCMMFCAQFMLVDGEAAYRHALTLLRDEWLSLPGVKAAGNPEFPLQFSLDEFDSIKRDVDDDDRARNLMNSLKQSLGDLFPNRGIVRHCEYDLVKKLLAEQKARIIDQLNCSGEERCVWDDVWPFESQKG